MLKRMLLRVVLFCIVAFLVLELVAVFLQGAKTGADENFNRAMQLYYIGTAIKPAGVWLGLGGIIFGIAALVVKQR